MGGWGAALSSPSSVMRFHCSASTTLLSTSMITAHGPTRGKLPETANGQVLSVQDNDCGPEARGARHLGHDMSGVTSSSIASTTGLALSERSEVCMAPARMTTNLPAGLRGRE